MAFVAGDLRLVRLHQGGRLAAGDDATHNYYLVDGAGDGRPILRCVSSGRAVRRELGDAGRHSSSRGRCRDAGDRLQHSAVL